MNIERKELTIEKTSVIRGKGKTLKREFYQAKICALISGSTSTIVQLRTIGTIGTIRTPHPHTGLDLGLGRGYDRYFIKCLQLWKPTTLLR